MEVTSRAAADMLTASRADTLRNVLLAVNRTGNKNINDRGTRIARQIAASTAMAVIARAAQRIHALARESQVDTDDMLGVAVAAMIEARQIEALDASPIPDDIMRGVYPQFQDDRKGLSGMLNARMIAMYFSTEEEKDGMPAGEHVLLGIIEGDIRDFIKKYNPKPPISTMEELEKDALVTHVNDFLTAVGLPGVLVVAYNDLPG